MNLALRAIHQVIGLPVRLNETLKRRLKLEACVANQGVCLHPESRIRNFKRDKHAILIGAHSHIRGELLVFRHGGMVHIGDSCYVGEGSRIWSAASVTIGNRVLISHEVNIHDTSSHSSSAASRHDHFMKIISSGHPTLVDDISAPIVIEDDAWLGFNVTILKGVRIGRGAVVGAASVVTKDVAPYTVVAGNPAKLIGAARL